MKAGKLRELGEANIAELARQIGILQSMAQRESSLHERYKVLSVQVDKNKKDIEVLRPRWKMIAEECKRREKARRDLAVRVKDVVKRGKRLSEQLEQEISAKAALLLKIKELTNLLGGARS